MVALTLTIGGWNIVRRGAINAHEIQRDRLLDQLAAPARMANPGLLGNFTFSESGAGRPGYERRKAMLSLAPVMLVLIAGLSLLVWRRRDVLKALAERRTAELKATIKSIGDAVIATDRHGRVRYMNPVAEHLTGWKETDARGVPLKDIFRVIDEITRVESADPVQRVLRDGRTAQLTDHALLISRDGSERPIADSAAPIRDGGGVILGVVLVFRDRSEERESRRKLEDSEAFSRAILENLPIGIAVNSVDPAVFIYMNDNFPAIYRTTRAEISSPDAFWTAVYPDPDFREKIRDRVLKDCAVGDPAGMQWDDIPLVREGRETFYISARNIPVPGRDMMISTVWDVTEEVRHKQERRGTIEFLQILMRRSELADMLQEVAQWWRHWAGCEAVRIRLQDGRTGENGRIEDPGCVPVARIPIQAGAVEIGKIQFLDSGPHVFSARDTARFERWARSLALAVRQRQAAEALRRSRQLSRIAGRAAQLGGWSFDVIAGRVRWSEEVAAIHEKEPGFSPSLEEAISFYDPQHRGRIRAVFDACIREGSGYDEIAPLITASGRKLWVRTIGEAERDASGKIIRVQGALQDVTGRVELETQLREAQKLESVGRLAGGVAHDFNNMLQTILGNTELLLELSGLGEKERGMLEEIGVTAQRSADLTRQLLAFLRRQPVQPRVLDINAAIEDLLKMLRRLLGENIDLVWEPAGDLRPIYMDPSQINQVLANLAVNARDAIGGVGKLTIETARAELDETYCRHNVDLTPGSYVVLTVSDNGCGMDDKTREQIFEPFFTTKPRGHGTGLGLPTVFGIVRQNKGFIKVYSEPGKGTTFSIYLPQSEEKAPASEDGSRSEEMTGGSETVLLVEDEKSILELTRRMLESLGYNVLSACGPAEALRDGAAHYGRIDLLLTDVVMPDMSGQDLWNELVGLRPGLRCLFMSGYTEDVIAHHGVIDKRLRFLQKPFSVSELARAVRAALS